MEAFGKKRWGIQSGGFIDLFSMITSFFVLYEVFIHWILDMGFLWEEAQRHKLTRGLFMLSGWSNYAIIDGMEMEMEMEMEMGMEMSAEVCVRIRG